MHPRSRHSAFTLVELLVVIGLIALLVGILLPVLSGIQARGRDLVSKSNIRQIVHLLLAYTSENRGQLPYAYYYVHGGAPPSGWDPSTFEDYSQVHLWSVVSHMALRSYPLEDNVEPPMKERPAFLRCPEALQVQPHLCPYAGSVTAFIWPWQDAGWGASAAMDVEPWMRLVEKQTKITQCLPFTALVWDRSMSPGMATQTGIVVGWDVDDRRLGS